MSALGSLYINLGEPDGELCGCTCEVGDWAADYIVDLTKQRDKLLAALEKCVTPLELYNAYGWPDRECVIQKTKATIAEVKGQS